MVLLGIEHMTEEVKVETRSWQGSDNTTTPFPMV